MLRIFPPAPHSVKYNPTSPTSNSSNFPVGWNKKQ